VSLDWYDNSFTRSCGVPPVAYGSASQALIETGSGSASGTSMLIPKLRVHIRSSTNARARDWARAPLLDLGGVASDLGARTIEGHPHTVSAAGTQGSSFARPDRRNEEWLSAGLDCGDVSEISVVCPPGRWWGPCANIE